ncbi:MAG: hypothetical protein ACFBRM_15540 [Pikeienuella sp.]
MDTRESTGGTNTVNVIDFFVPGAGNRVISRIEFDDGEIFPLTDENLAALGVEFHAVPLPGGLALLLGGLGAIAALTARQPRRGNLGAPVDA